MMTRPLAVTALLLLCSCGQGGESKQPAAAASAQVPSAPPPAPTASAFASAEAAADGARKVEQESDLASFDYAYPAAAGRIPALKAMLDGDLAEQQATITQQAREGRKDAKESGFPFNPYGHSTDWSVVTELPGWLSLAAQRWEFTGGAHGNPWSETLLWDKAANVKRMPVELFRSKAALTAAIQQPFCAALDKERAKRRGEPVRRGSGDPFDECIDPVESTVILGSSDHQHFNRIGVLVDPYEAGPYAEGNYEVTLPVTPAVVAAVKPEYRGVFAAGR